MWVILGNSKPSEIIHLLYRKLSLSHVRGSILCQSVSLDWKTELLLFTASLEIGCHPLRPPWPQSPGFCVICKNNFSSSFNSCKHSSCPFWALLVCRWIYGGVKKTKYMLIKAYVVRRNEKTLESNVYYTAGSALWCLYILLHLLLATTLEVMSLLPGFYTR